jgi:hypothetical protein
MDLRGMDRWRMEFKRCSELYAADTPHENDDTNVAVYDRAIFKLVLGSQMFTELGAGFRALFPVSTNKTEWLD